MACCCGLIILKLSCAFTPTNTINPHFIISAGIGFLLRQKQGIFRLVSPTMKNLVFIVEDNPVQQKMLQVHFEQMLGNYTVKTFSQPEDMLAHLEEKPFAIVLDHFFPEHSSKTGLDYLRKLREEYEEIPVIYYTTLNDDKVRMEVKKLGGEDYILKDSASLVRLRTALDRLHERKSVKKNIFQKIFGR
jgi:CheY-like chemotaxis protein